MSLLLLLSDDAFNPRSLFAAGEQGFWYGPSDFSTMFQDAAGTTPVTAVGQSVGRILDKSGRGNHATQSTGSSRPTVEARVNLLTKSEELDHADWQKVGVTVTANAGAGYDGSMTLDKVVEVSAANVPRIAQSKPTTAGLQYTAYFDAKAAERTQIRIVAEGSALRAAYYNLSTGTVVSAGSSASASITALGNGVYRCQLTYTATAATSQLYVATAESGAVVSSGDPTKGVLLGRADFRLTSDAQYPYQRVNTATDYADVWAARYNLFDKTDDHFTAAAGGAGTTGILLAVGVMVPAAGTARTIFSDLGTNAGYKLGIDAENKVVFSGGTGAAFTTLTSAGALTAGQKYILMAWHDGTNLNLSINNVAETPVAQGTVTAGTAGFTIGKDNGAASGYWGDRIYNMVYRKNDTSSAAQRSGLYTYIVGKMGGL